MDNQDNQPKKVSWLDKLLLKIWSNLEMRRLAKSMTIGNVVFDKLHEVFSGVERIDIFPHGGDRRDFILVLDRETALFFYQDGDHFKYDGFEMGKYNKGEVTVFDDLANKDLSPYPDEEDEAGEADKKPLCEH